MRVLEITGEPIFHGGQERFIYSLIENINDPELVIDVLTPYSADNDSFCQLIEEKGGRVFCLGMNFQPGKSRKTLYKAILDFLKKENYDVVHIHSGSISVLAYAASAAKLAGVKKIIVHSHCTAINSIKHTLVKIAFGAKIKNSATDFWACSFDAGADKYPRSVVKNKLVVIPNGIKTSDFERNEAARKAIRDKLEIPDDCYVIGHVGRFSYQKNHEMLIDLFIRIKERCESCKLLLVGDGELFQDIKRMVKSQGLDQDVIFTGNVNNAHEYYQAMDCFLFPSRFEGFGYVALEAQAAGIPCIISSEVPTDVMVGKNIERIPLADADEWVEKAIGYRGTTAVNNTERILNAGYDVKRTAEIIKNSYYEAE